MAELSGGDAAANAAMLRRFWRGKPGARREAVLLNAALGLVVAEGGRRTPEGYERARVALDSGAERSPRSRRCARPRLRGVTVARRERRLASRGSWRTSGRASTGGSTDPGRRAGEPRTAPAFVASLREPGIRIVAEIKRRSPSAGEILSGADGRIETLALAYRRGHAAAISVVTEEDHFGGKPDWMTRAKHISGLPVLMKDFSVDGAAARLRGPLGADAVLLIVRALSDEELARPAARRGGTRPGGRRRSARGG